MSEGTSTFFDEVRTGLRALGLAASAAPELALRVRLQAGPELHVLDVDRTDRALRLIGPADVVGLAGDAIGSTQPPDRFTNYPYNLFVTLDLVEADLPWRLSPAGSTAPWLVLIVVPAGPDVERQPAQRDLPELLRVRGNRRDALPDLARSRGWAHAHERDGKTVARLLCPTPLAPGKAYVAALVPAFRGGRDAGLGRSPGGDPLAPAWSAEEVTSAGGVIELPVYHGWTFTTAKTADFAEQAEQLRRIAPAARARLGLRAIGVGPCAHVVPTAAPGGWTQTPGGALVGATVDPPSATPGQRAWFAAALAGTSPTTGATGYDPLRDDPQLAPPDYGRTLVPRGAAAPWRATLNQTPAFRALAGVGAELVRRHQEELTADLLDRVGAVRDAPRERRRLLLGTVVALGRVGRITAMPDEALLLAARFAAADLPEGTARSAPRGTFSAALRRQVRGAAPAGHRQRRAGPGGLGPTLTRFAAGTLVKLRQWDPHLAVTAVPGPLAPAAATVRAALRPFSALRRAQPGLSPTLAQIAAAGTTALLTGAGLRVAADFTLAHPLSAWLCAIDPDLLVPGLGGLPEHSVALLSVNRPAVEALLVGANDALAREVLWRDLPVPRGATLLRRFWAGATADDTGPIRRWTGELGGNLRGNVSLVLVLRSPLLHLYPNLEIALHPSDGQRPVLGTSAPLRFRGRFDAGTLYAGFDGLSRAAARGDDGGPGWFVGLCQPAGDPTFGSDIDPAGGRSVGGRPLRDVFLTATGPAALAGALLRRRSRVFIHASFLL